MVTGPPGPEAASVLLGLDVAALSAEQVHAVVLACERLIRAAHAVQAEAMVAAAGPEPVANPESGREPLDDAAGGVGGDLGPRRGGWPSISAAAGSSSWGGSTPPAIWVRGCRGPGRRCGPGSGVSTRRG